jgi:hypothetical protein
MAIDIHWEDREGHILHYRFIDLWNSADVLVRKHQMWNMLNLVNHQVTIFWDFTDEATLPHQSRLPLLRTLMDAHPNIGEVILIGSLPRMRFIEDMMRMRQPQRHYRSAPDLTTAHRMIEAHA